MKYLLLMLVLLSGCSTVKIVRFPSPHSDQLEAIESKCKGLTPDTTLILREDKDIQTSPRSWSLDIEVKCQFGNYTETYTAHSAVFGIGDPNK